ncbi:MAG: hypothetical protein GXZ09_09820 [Syntrophomonadaceae bacterium]|nr:hypothetical protein [Syntrophomonadaceae bacterium]
MYSIYFYRIYETGCEEIYLLKVEQTWAGEHGLARHRLVRTDPKSIRMEVPPLVVNLGAQEVPWGEGKLSLECQARIYDIGAVSLCLKYQNDGLLPRIEDVALAFAAQRGLENIFGDYLEQLQGLLNPMLPCTIDPTFYEDYSIYHIESPQQISDTAALLMGEKAAFSPQMREQIMKNRLSYSQDDFVIVTWDTALICDQEDPADLRDLIEFANVQLLELRYYEDLLTRHMDRMYDDIQKVDKDSRFKRSRQYRRIMSRLMEFIADISEVTEKIDNFIKITEDIYYARVYQMTLKVLRAEQWSESVNRKLQVIQQNYALLSNEVNIQHSNSLEWIIIILIALEFGFYILETLW